MSDPAPFSPDDFDAAMAAVGPFEASPHLAVAVSGGADSLALCLLTHRWAEGRGGRATALTVDHGLRPGSCTEALQVGPWLTGRGIAHQVLSWTGKKPAAGVQQAARTARYRLMAQWCADAGVLHLLLGHHQQDQAETVLMRQCRGSGLDGLAGMAAVVETATVRFLRPLLNAAPPRLRAVLSAAGQPWIEDPSNSDPAYTRNRVRAMLPGLAESGVAVPRINATAATMARARMALERAVAALLARCCRLHGEGYARIDARAMASAPPEVAARALGRVLTTVGGREHAPPAEKLERIFFQLVRSHLLTAGTLGRCRLVRTDDDILVCREGRGLPAARMVVADVSVHWDGRFLIDIAASEGGSAEDIRLTALGASGAERIRSELAYHVNVPRQVRAALPALADEAGILAVPHLHYHRPDAERARVRFRSLSFRPLRALTGGRWYLA